MPTLLRSCLALALCVQLCGAAEAGPREPETLPDLELLEFLGEWETEDGELIDPLSFERTAGPDPSPGESGRRADSPRSGSRQGEEVTQPGSGQSGDDDAPSIID